MRRIVISTVSTVAGLVALLGLKPDLGVAQPAVEPVASSVGSTAEAGSSGSASGSSPGSSARSSSGSSSSGASAGGPSPSAARTLTGAAVATRYGPVQIAVTVQGGHLTAVQVLRYPSSNSRDRQINGYALPLLVQSTLHANSASIDMVSGATYTSEGYARSLQSALDQAGW